MKKASYAHQKGVTLLEVLIIAAIIGVVALISQVGIKFVNSLSRERVLLEAQRDTEVLLYQIVRDVRNAYNIKEILTTTPHSLILSAYNIRLGGNGPKVYDVNDNHFDLAANRGTITYEFVNNAVDGTFIRRIEDFPAVGRHIEQIFLRNKLEASDNGAVFSPFPFDDDPPYDSVEIAFRTKPPAFDVPAKTYKAQAMLRARPDGV